MIDEYYLLAKGKKMNLAFAFFKAYAMPSHGVEIIEGIPVTLKDGVMYAFQIETPSVTPIILGTCSPTKRVIWEHRDSEATWLSSFRATLVAKSRK